jgi:hypothetical protein
MRRSKLRVTLTGLTAAALLIGAAWATVRQAGDDAALGAAQGRDTPGFGMDVPGLVPQHVLEKLVIACSENEDVAILGAAALALDAAARRARD